MSGQTIIIDQKNPDENVGQKFELVDLIAADFVFSSAGENVSVCHRCDKIIMDSVCENNICDHLTCYTCCYSRNSTWEPVKTIDCCIACNTKCRWTISQNLTRALHRSSLQCPITGCEKTFPFDELKNHNLVHIKLTPLPTDPFDFVAPIISFATLVSIIALVASIPGAFDQPKRNVYNQPMVYSWFTPSCMSTIFCFALIYILAWWFPAQDPDPIRDNIDKKIAACIDEELLA